MSNYTIAVNWAGKDALSDSDPAKVISGSDFHTEFNTAKDAINSKANLNGDSQESFEASTPVSTNDSTNKVATTEFVTNVLKAVYPVGSIYTTTDSTVPSDSTRLGFGNWEAFGAGRVLIGAGTSTKDDQVIVATSIVSGKKYQILTTGDTDFTLIGSADSDVDTVFTATGTGEGTGTVAEVQDFTAAVEGGEFNHTLTVSEMPSHTHTEEGVSTTGDDATSVGGGVTELQSSSNNTSETGGGQAHNNLQPYVVVYMWKRIAD